MFSVIIPAYNRARLVAQAIESVLTQCGSAGEVIVVDDGSTDDTADAASRFTGVRVERFSRSRGPSAARNHGVNVATGEYLAFLDSDDLAAPGRFHRHIEMLQADAEAHIVMGSQWRFRGDEVPRSGPTSHNDPDVAVGPTVASMTLRRRDFLRAGYFDESLRLSEFIEWYVRAAEVGLKVRHDPAIALWRRAHGGEHQSRNKELLSQYSVVLKRMLDRRRDKVASDCAAVSDAL